MLPKTTRCESSIKHVFSGTLVHSTAENMMDICQNKIIGVDDEGKVTEAVRFSCDHSKSFGWILFAQFLPLCLGRCKNL